MGKSNHCRQQYLLIWVSRNEFSRMCFPKTASSMQGPQEAGISPGSWQLRSKPKAVYGDDMVAVPRPDAAAVACHAGALAARWRDLGCVRAGGVLRCVFCLTERCAAPLPLLSILLSHWNNRGMWPLQRYSKHANTLPPVAPTALMDTCACCCRALIFQLPSPLTGPLPPRSPSPIFLTFLFGAQRGLIFSFLKLALLHLKGRAAGGRSQKGVVKERDLKMAAILAVICLCHLYVVTCLCELMTAQWR